MEKVRNKVYNTLDFPHSGMKSGGRLERRVVGECHGGLVDGVLDGPPVIAVVATERNTIEGPVEHRVGIKGRRLMAEEVTAEEAGIIRDSLGLHEPGELGEKKPGSSRRRGPYCHHR